MMPLNTQKPVLVICNEQFCYNTNYGTVIWFKTRVKLLKLFMSNPNRSFYVREITRKIDEQINSVRRELANLLSIGLITSDSTNNKLYYEVDQKYEHYGALRELFTGKNHLLLLLQTK